MNGERGPSKTHTIKEWASRSTQDGKLGKAQKHDDHDDREEHVRESLLYYHYY